MTLIERTGNGTPTALYSHGAAPLKTTLESNPW